MKSQTKQYLEIALLTASILVVIGTVTVFFQKLPIENTTLAMDWKTEWAAMRGGNLHYQPAEGVRFPPWSLLPLLPLGLLPMKTAWGILAGISICIVAASVPRIRPKQLYLMSVLLAVTSFASVRNIVDGNFEAVVVAGVALLIYAYQNENVGLLVLGLILATIKIQVVTLLLLILLVYTILTWQKRKWLRAGALAGAVIIPSLIWRGKDWYIAVFGANYAKYTNSIIDISLSAALTRLEFIPPGFIALALVIILTVTITVAWKTRHSLSPVKAGSFIAASLLLAPYAAGNSVLSLLVIGIIPLFQTRPWLGGSLLVLFNIPYFWTTEFLFNYQAYYWTCLVFIAWVILTWRSIRNAN